MPGAVEPSSPPAGPVTQPPVPVDQTPAQVAGAVATTGKQLGALDPAKLGRKAGLAVKDRRARGGTARLHLTGQGQRPDGRARLRLGQGDQGAGR